MTEKTAKPPEAAPTHDETYRSSQLTVRNPTLALEGFEARFKDRETEHPHDVMAVGNKAAMLSYRDTGEDWAEAIDNYFNEETE